VQLLVQISELQSHIVLCRFWAGFLQVVELEVKQDAEELRVRAAAAAQVAQVCLHNLVQILLKTKHSSTPRSTRRRRVFGFPQWRS